MLIFCCFQKPTTVLARPETPVPAETTANVLAAARQAAMPAPVEITASVPNLQLPQALAAANLEEALALVETTVNARPALVATIANAQLLVDPVDAKLII